MKNDTPVDHVPSYVDLDAEVKVKSGINVGGNDQLPAVKAFLKHPARALSARELAVLLNIGEDEATDVLEILSRDDLIVRTNELDGDQFRFRLI
jgi:hypothetical protein